MPQNGAPALITQLWQPPLTKYYFHVHILNCQTPTGILAFWGVFLTWLLPLFCTVDWFQHSSDQPAFLRALWLECKTEFETCIHYEINNQCCYWYTAQHTTGIVLFTTNIRYNKFSMQTYTATLLRYFSTDTYLLKYVENETEQKACLKVWWTQTKLFNMCWSFFFQGEKKACISL